MLSNALAEIVAASGFHHNPDSMERRDAGKQNEICIAGMCVEPVGNTHLDTPMETCPTRLYFEDHQSDSGTSILLAIQNFVNHLSEQFDFTGFWN